LQFAFESQVKMHGFDPKEAIIQVSPRLGKHTIDTERILEVLEAEGASIAVVLFSGVQYYTGQCFEMEKITAAGHQQVD
jgi:kynureninase